MAELTLHGGCTFCNAQLWQMRDNTVPSPSKIAGIKQMPLSDRKWDADTVLAINFNNVLSSGNIDGYFQDVKYFKIFKKLSQQPELLDVFTTPTEHVGVIEDFMVGSRCPYTYYTRPILQAKDAKGRTYEKVGTTVKSRPYELNDGIIRIIGLIQDEDNSDLYHIDNRNMWHISLNAVDAGFSNTIAKTFTDTLHKYQKETVGNGAYRTFDIEGLLGQYDCETNRYNDTYDDIIEWERFMSSGELKAAIDIRGIITIGDIDANSFQYNPNSNHTVSVKFSFRQFDDIANISIHGRQLPANPIYNDVLAEKMSAPLLENINRTDTLSYLTTPRE